jgi:hypothetical protein
MSVGVMKDYKLEVTRLSYTGLAVELEHLKIETRLTIDRDEVVVYYESMKRKLI